MRVPLALVLLMAPQPAWADAAMDTVQAALAAEHAAVAEQAKIFVERVGEADLYLIDRIGSTKLHIVRNPERSPQEIIIVDGVSWLRTAGGWQKSPLRTVASSVPSISGLLKSGLTDLSEQAPIDGNRVFVGNIAWAEGRRNVGRFELRIDAAGLPRIMRFDGTCAGAPCRFHQKIAYDNQQTIAPPN